MAKVKVSIGITWISKWECIVLHAPQRKGWHLSAFDGENAEFEEDLGGRDLEWDHFRSSFFCLLGLELLLVSLQMM
jgi:hypothetical protein